MTQEQKERLAREYAENEYKIGDAAYDKAMANLIERVYLDALDARDEEFALLKAEIEDDNAVMMQLRAELEEAKNPWVSVEERLPQEGQLIVEAYTLVAKADGYTQSTEHFLMAKYKGKFVCDGKEEHYPIGSSTSTTHHWMPIPSVEGGEA